MKKSLKSIIEAVERLGLPKVDITFAKEFLAHHEYELCLDTIVTQLYELYIQIDEKVLNSINGYWEIRIAKRKVFILKSIDKEKSRLII